MPFMITERHPLVSILGLIICLIFFLFIKAIYFYLAEHSLLANSEYAFYVCKEILLLVDALLC